MQKKSTRRRAEHSIDSPGGLREHSETQTFRIERARRAGVFRGRRAAGSNRAAGMCGACNQCRLRFSRESAGQRAHGRPTGRSRDQHGLLPSRFHLLRRIGSIGRIFARPKPTTEDPCRSAAQYRRQGECDRCGRGGVERQESRPRRRRLRRRSRRCHLIDQPWLCRHVDRYGPLGGCGRLFRTQSGRHAQLRSDRGFRFGWNPRATCLGRELGEDVLRRGARPQVLDGLLDRRPPRPLPGAEFPARLRRHSGRRQCVQLGPVHYRRAMARSGHERRSWRADHVDQAQRRDGRGAPGMRRGGCDPG